MSVLGRFKDIMDANINALLDKCEDPAKMIDQTLRNLNKDLEGVKKETASVIAEEKRCKREVEKFQSEVNKWDDYARKALASGNESDARKFLAEKTKSASALEDAQKVYDRAKENSDKVRKMHDKLQSDIRDLESRQSTIKAKLSVAKTQQSINKMASSTRASGTMSKFASLEARADQALDAAEAEAELNFGTESDAEKLTREYDHGEYSVSVDDELERMKAEMGLSTPQAAAPIEE